jgi:hypothetical protein
MVCIIDLGHTFNNDVFGQSKHTIEIPLRPSSNLFFRQYHRNILHILASDSMHRPLPYRATAPASITGRFVYVRNAKNVSTAC